MHGAVALAQRKCSQNSVLDYARAPLFSCIRNTCDARQGVSAARAAMLACAAAPPAPTVVYVAKMLAVPAGSLPRGAQRDAGPGGDPTDPAGEVFLAFGRVFAGTLRDGDRVHVLSAAYDPAEPGRHRQEAQVSWSGVGCCPSSRWFECVHHCWAMFMHLETGSC